jgi:Flp pilus assembly protein TadB
MVIVLFMVMGIALVADSAESDNIIAPLADEFGAPITSIEEGVGIFTTLVKWVYTIFFIVAVLFILMAAYSFVTSQGSAEKVQKAKDQLKWAIIAVVIALLSSGFALVIQNFINEEAPPADENGYGGPYF